MEMHQYGKRLLIVRRQRELPSMVRRAIVSATKHAQPLGD
ncbi:hypothetical protein MPS_5583 [Mycobacterium pseudoshottsii JCM 15466]|nr:hypothetical protein MMSP_3854 [Mycobacterium sp. 012931]GAQ41251.1 hypothetical protein MPS_5583 [Mycobacterium pseudoshottsii JCM 15466]